MTESEQIKFLETLARHQSQITQIVALLCEVSDQVSIGNATALNNAVHVVSICRNQVSQFSAGLINTCFEVEQREAAKEQGQ